MLISVMSVGQKSLSVANCLMFCSMNCYVVLLMDDGRNLCKSLETQNIEVAVTDYFPK
jgi:hypothetical protein